MSLPLTGKRARLSDRVVPIHILAKASGGGFPSVLNKRHPHINLSNIKDHGTFARL